jgi:uncharacterized protein YdhG (YjbR/CyaY superfamily)
VKAPPKKTQAKTVEAYLAAAPKEQRDLLNKVRKTIKAAAPQATEGISYGIVGFKQHGERLIYYGYWKTHCALYGAGAGTMKFTPEDPIPDRVVTKLVKDRLAEIERKGARSR